MRKRALNASGAMGRRPGETTKRRCVLAAALVLASTLASPASAQIWIVGDDDWFNAANWNPATVPAAGGSVIVSNGGTARLNGVAETALLNSLSVGISSSGTGAGTVQSTGVKVRTAGTINVGTVVTSGSFAGGVLTITGAGANANTANVGVIFGAAGAATATGAMSVGGSLPISNGLVQVGQMFGAGRGSSAQGTLSIGGDAGTASGFLIVGNVTGQNATEVGSQSTGQFSVLNGGGLNLAGGTSVYIGTTVGVDRVVEAGPPSATFINRAQGTVAIDGTLTIQGNTGFVGIGVTTGGEANGALSVGALNMVGASRINSLQVGTSQANGQATGSFASGSGNLQVSGTMSVGTTSGGSAQATVNLGSGQLQGNNSGGLRSGVGLGPSTAVVSAAGTVNAAGVSGFTSYDVGVLNGAMAAGSFAQGVVNGVGAGAASSTNQINVGNVFGTGSATTAIGSMVVDGALQVNNGFVQVGQMFGAGRGSSAQGTLSIGGDAGTASGFLIVGNVTGQNATEVGSQSTGQFSVLNGGGLNLAGGTSVYIGTTVGVDRVVEAGPPSATFINRAQGTVAIDGTLTIQGNTGFVGIGVTTGGEANGALSVGALNMGASRINALQVGTSQANGQATGSLTANGGTLNVENLFLGYTSGGSADGRLELTGTIFTAERVLAGQGGGVAHMSITDSIATISDYLTLLNGELSLDRSLMTIDGIFTLGDDATLRIDVDGLLRGTEYGAVNAGFAYLDGILRVDLGDLLPVGDSMVFDLLRSSALDGILGDFDTFLFTGLQNGYAAFAGIEVDNDVEVYRLRIARATVPEPGSIALILLCFAIMLVMHRTRVSAQPSKIGR